MKTIKININKKNKVPHMDNVDVFYFPRMRLDVPWVVLPVGVTDRLTSGSLNRNDSTIRVTG